MDPISIHVDSHHDSHNKHQKHSHHHKHVSEAQHLYFASHRDESPKNPLQNSQLHYSLVVDKDTFKDSIARQRVLETEADQPKPSKMTGLTVSEILPASHKSTKSTNPDSLSRSGYLQPKKISNDQERFFKEAYYGTLDQPASFKKKDGYFSDFTDSSRVINQDYKNQKKASMGQSRYLSRPIMFTTINSKNRLSTLNPTDISNLSEIKDMNNTMGTPPLIVSPNGSKVGISFDKKDHVKNNSSYKLPALDTGRSIEKDKNYFPGRIVSTEVSPQRKTKATLPIHSPTIKTLKSYESLSHSKLNDTLGKQSEPYSAYTRTMGNESPSKLSPLRSRTKSPEYQSSQFLQTMTKYHTKELVETLVNDHEIKTRLNSDPFKFLQGNNEVNNLRGSNIAIQKMNTDVKFGRNHPGRTLSYMKEPNKQVYREGDAMEQLHRFEENILGWAKSVPNFGKQRWTYDKAWEFRLI